MTGCIFIAGYDLNQARNYTIIVLEFPDLDPAIIHRFIDALYVALFGSILLLIVLYYLGDDGQAAFFPSYIATLLAIPLLLLQPNRQVLWDPRLACAVLFAIYLGITSLWSHQPGWHYPAYAILLVTFLVGAMLTAQRLPRLMHWVVTLSILSAAISASISIYLYYSVGYNPLDEKDRLYALGRNYTPTVSALSYSIPLIMAATRVTLTPALLERVLYLLLTAPLAWAIILSGTRSVMIGLVAAALLSLLVLTRASWRERLGIAAGILTTIVMIALAAYLSGYDDMLLRRASSFRPQIWAAAIERITAGNWVFGNGISVSSVLNWQHLSFDHAHSIYLSTLFYGGIIGFGLLVGLIVLSAGPLFRPLASELHAIAFATLTFSLVTLAMDGDRLVAKVDHLWIAFWLPMLLAWTAVSARKLTK